MLYCDKCNISVDGTPDYCPLCQGQLSGRPESADSYPHIGRKSDYLALSMKIAAILTVAAVCVCAAVDYTVSDSITGWWLYVAGGAASFWAIFGIAVTRRKNVTKSIIFTTVVISIIAVLWDVFTGNRGWALDYVLPISCCAAMLSMAVIARILNLHIEQYIYYLILDIVFGIIPLLLMLFNAITVVIPSVICVAASAISLSALLIFEGKALRAEIVRRTHL